MEVNGQTHAWATLPPGNNTSTHWIGGCEGTRPRLDVLEKKTISFCPYWKLNPGLSTLSIHQLCFPGSHTFVCGLFNNTVCNFEFLHKMTTLPLDLPCSGPVTHSGENLTTGKTHGKKPDRFSLNDDTDVKKVLRFKYATWNIRGLGEKNKNKIIQHTSPPSVVTW
jgi:hypothetical protein